MVAASLKHIRRHQLPPNARYSLSLFSLHKATRSKWSTLFRLLTDAFLLGTTGCTLVGRHERRRVRPHPHSLTTRTPRKINTTNRPSPHEKYSAGDDGGESADECGGGGGGGGGEGCADTVEGRKRERNRRHSRKSRERRKAKVEDLGKKVRFLRHCKCWFGLVLRCVGAGGAWCRGFCDLLLVVLVVVNSKV